MAEPTLLVGDRVSIPTFGNGIVRFFGPTQFQPGEWVGVQLDNDGSVKGVRYFTCDPNCGVFVRATQVSLLQKTSPSTPINSSAQNVGVEKPPLPALSPQKPPALPAGGSFVTVPLTPPTAPVGITTQAPAPQPAPAAATNPTPISNVPPPSNPNPTPASIVSTPVPSASAPQNVPGSSHLAVSTSPAATTTPPQHAASAVVPTSVGNLPSDARSPPQRGPLIPSSGSNSRPLSPAATVSHLPPEVERRTAQQQRVQAELQERTRVMFNQVGDYVRAELGVTLEDYKMLETMNNVSKDKYAEMAQITEGLRGQMAQLENSYKELEPFLSKINDIEAGVVELEKAVTMLNAYAKRLEEKLRMPDKSALAAGPAASPVKTTP